MTRRSPYRVLLASLFAALQMVAGGCAPETGEPEPTAPQEPDFGLGAKADEGGCEPAAELCWTSPDQASLRALQILQQDVVLGELAAADALPLALDHLEELSHKLNDEDLALLDAARSADEATAGDTLQRLWEGPVARLQALHIAAQMVPIGAVVERERLGGADDPGTPAPEDGASAAELRYTAGMQESLRRLRDAGVAGRLYAKLLEVGGLLERDYAPSAPVVSFELPADGQPSRRDAVEGIVRRHSLASGAIGAVSGAVSLVPVAGIALSIPVGSVAGFAVYTKMTFSVAAAHGWDLRQGANLYVVTMFLLSDDALEEVGAEMAASVALPGLIRGVGQLLGVRLATTEAIRFAVPVLTFLTRFLTRKARQLVERVARATVGRAVGSQILGWATLGLNVLASGLADYWAARRVGEHVAIVSRRWLWDLPADAVTRLEQDAARSCLMRATAATLLADGSLSAAEERYYQALLASPVPDAGDRWYRLSGTERTALTGPLAARSARLDADCLREHFGEAAAYDRLTVLSQLYAAAAIDGAIALPEADLYARARSSLEGGGWFDGPMLEPYQLEFVERVVRQAVGTEAAAVDETYRDEVDMLSLEQRLPWLQAIPTDVAEDYTGVMAGR